MDSIAVFAPEQHEPLIEGIQKSAHQVCRQLTNMGYRPLVFSQRSYGTPFKNERYQVVERFATTGPRLIKYFAWLIEAKKTVAELKSKKPTRLIVFSLDWSFLPALFSVCKKIPELPITVAIFSMRELTGPAKQFILRHGTSGRVQFWCFSKYVAERLSDLGVPRDAITVAPVFFTMPQQETAAKGHKQEGSYDVAYLSSSDTSAGVETVIELAKAVPNIRITLAIREFSEKEEQRVKAFLEKLTAQKLSNIRVVRTIADMPGFLSMMDAVILPPKDELSTMAVPLVALEAAYAGCAVFASGLPVFEELEQMGLLKRFNSTAELSEIIRTSARAPQRSAESREKVTSLLRTDAFVKNTILDAVS